MKNNNNYMVFDTNGGIAYFYKVEDGKPKVFANWMIGSLGLINSMDEEIINKDISELEPVSDKMAHFLEFIQNNEYGHTPLEGDLENPYICNCEDDDEYEYCKCGKEG